MKWGDLFSKRDPQEKKDVTAKPKLAEGIIPHKTKIIFLVPGALNSIVPGGIHHKKGYVPYYGTDIVSVLSKKYEIQVAEGLLPTGSFHDNGQLVYAQLKKLGENRTNEIEVLIIGHSSGGLYTLSALSEKTDLPFVSKVVFISTPLKGAVLADVFATRSSDVLIKTLKMVNLFPGLNQLRRAEIRTYMLTIQVPPHIQFYATSGLAGHDKHRALDFADLITKIMIRTNDLIKRKTGVSSDGIVEITSSMPKTLKLKNMGGELVEIRLLENLITDLNHWYLFWNKQLIFYPRRRQIIKTRKKLYQDLLVTTGF